MEKRVTIKTNADALAYLASINFNTSRFKTDDDGNSYEEHRITCKRCGGAGYYPTPRHGACYECNGNPPNYIARTGIVAIAKKARKQELAAAARTRKAEKKSAAFNAKSEAKAVAFDAAYPTLRADLADYLPLYCETEGYNVAKKTHRILNDMAGKLAKWGDMSEKAAAFARKLLDDESAPKATLEEGRREMTGTVVSVKLTVGYNGEDVWKMTVKLDGEGCRVWGSVPRAFADAVVEARLPTGAAFDEVAKGATITFTGTVTRSDDSPDFGFFKRPTIADKDIALAWVAPEPFDVTKPYLDERCLHCDSARHASEDCPAEAHHCRMMES